MYNLSTSKAIYAAFRLKFLRFQIFFNGLRTQPTNQPPVRDYDPDTPLGMMGDFAIALDAIFGQPHP